ncbi:MAG: nickel insertion protein [Blautia sp.]
MLLGALLDLIPDKDRWIQNFNQIGIPHMEAKWNRESRCGIGGTHVSILIRGHEERSEELPGSPSHHHHHHHNTLSSVQGTIDLYVSRSVKEKALDVYHLLSQAEASVHGCPVDQIHFHEVTTGCHRDIVGHYAPGRISPTHILASPIHVGSGQIHCAHGSSCPHLPPPFVKRYSFLQWPDSRGAVHPHRSCSPAVFCRTIHQFPCHSI